MKQLKRISQAALLLVMTVSLGACGSPAVTETPQPTTDLSVVKTDAVSTVIAQLTAEAPKVVPTSAPTSTTASVFTATLPVLATSAPVVLPTATKTKIVYSSGGAVAPTVNTYVDQGKLTFQNPKDGTVLSPGVDFDAVWKIVNTGRRDWDDTFYFKYVSGTPKGLNFDKGMLPATKKGDEVTVTVDMNAPTEPGTYTSQWTLVNDDAVSFFHFFITIVVK